MAAPKLNSMLMANVADQAMFKSNAGPVKSRGKTQEKPAAGTDSRTSHMIHTNSCLIP